MVHAIQHTKQGNVPWCIHLVKHTPMKLSYQSTRLYTVHYSEWSYLKQLWKFLNGEMKHYLVRRLWVRHAETALGKQSTWKLLKVLGHWESCYPVFTECYLSQRWARGLVCRKVCYIINFKFQTYGTVTYLVPCTEACTGACTHTHTYNIYNIYSNVRWGFSP
jgi:hypothetical protein